MFTPTPLLALASLSLVPAPQAPKSAPPPGTVFIQGGSTYIGTEKAEVEKAAEENAARASNLACETPMHQRSVDSFFLGVTEVTNEQYAEYVKATGARPPDSWGIKAIEAAGQAYATEIGLKRKEAREAGRPMPDFPAFDQVQWWNDHWRDAPWEVSPAIATMPVGYVDYTEVQGYVRWAGVRMMTEFEFQRAARAGTKNAYPWGDKWDPAMCANGGQGLKNAKPVGSYPNAKTATGLYDLAGNVWEWTSSPFVEYPGFKVIQVKQRKETKDLLVRWDAGQRVVVGGSYATESPSAARIATRRPTDVTQSAEAMGFRIAASTSPGVDIAASLLHRGLEQRPQGLKYDETKAAVCDRWTTAAGTATVPGYQVITDYDYLVFIPVVGLEFSALNQLDQTSFDEGPVHLGALATTIDMLQPALPAGAYTVAMRGPGPLKRHESVHGAVPPADPKKNAIAPPQDAKPAPQEPKPAEPAKDKPKEKVVEPIVYPEGMNPDQRNLVFFDHDGKMVGFLHISEMEFATPKPHTIEIGKAVANLGTSDKPNQVSATGVKMKVTAWAKVSNRGVTFTLPLMFQPDAITADWRR